MALTPKERAAIASLKRLAKNWPPGLWLFANNTIWIMRVGEDGERVMDDVGGVDRMYEIDHVDIPCDGGDW